MPKKKKQKIKFKKILNHPRSEEIIKKLSDGESVRDLEKWITRQYPRTPRFRVTAQSLQKFRKEHLQITGKVLKDIQDAAAIQQKEINKEMAQKQLEQSNAYQEKINEVAGTHLDVAERILQLDKVISSRIEYWYNELQNGSVLPNAADKEIRAYMDRQIETLKSYKKLVEGMADQTVQHNVNVSVMNDQISIIRDAIKEVLLEIDAEKAILFIERLRNKLSSLNYSQEKEGEFDSLDTLMNAND